MVNNRHNRKESLFKTMVRFLTFRGVDLLSLIVTIGKGKTPTVPGNVKNVLILDIGLLGDLLMTTPLIAGVKDHFPEAAITVVCTPWAVEAISTNRQVDRIHTYEAFWEDRDSSGRPKLKHAVSTIRLVSFLRRHDYDIVFVVTAREQPFVALLAYLSRSKIRVGTAYPLGRRFLTHSVEHKDEHVTMMKQNLLLAVFPEARLNYRMVYTVTEKSESSVVRLLAHHGMADRKPVICITPSTLQTAKQWAVDSWIALIERLIHDDSTVFVCGGLSDAAYNEGIYEKVSDHEACVNLTGKISLNEFAALLRRTRCLITVESAPMHLAAALSIPCVVLQSRIYDGKRFQPLNSGAEILSREVECAGCSKGCELPQCMAFAVDEVYTAINERLGPAGARAPIEWVNAK